MSEDGTQLDRRRFLSSAMGFGASTGLAALTPDHSLGAEQQSKPTSRLAEPTSAQLQYETGDLPAEDGRFIDNPMSDHMVDVLKSVGIEYITTNPGSAFRGLHESIINYGGNRAPELLTCLHEEICVGMGHGYAKVAGKPLAALVHGTVGLQHAAMSVYNAWCDRVPVLLLAGNHLDATHRKGWVHWNHAVQDAGALLRDCTKWDDAPASLPHFSESMVRACRVATTPPMAPVLMVVDGDMQEKPLTGTAPPIPRLALPSFPQGDAAAIDQAATLLVNAQDPLLVVGRAVRSARGMQDLIELAELLQIPVIDRRARMNFPTTHYLNQTERGRSLLLEADVILGIELVDVFGTFNRFSDVPGAHAQRAISEQAKVITLGVDGLHKANYQDFQRYASVDLEILGDGETTLRPLIEAVRARLSKAARNRAHARIAQLRELHAQAREEALEQARLGWNAQPVSIPRLCADLWQEIRHHDWALVSDTSFQGDWPFRLWDFDKHYQFIGGSGGAGMGYTAPAAIGAALAHRAHGRLAVSIQGDGDLMYVPGALWTAAHHRIPLLTVMHNNRAYHQEIMHVQRMAARRQRGIDRAHIGTVIDDPPIDYAALAASMGIWSEGPVSNPDDFLPALRRAIAVVKSGAPALIDIITQGR
jgi:acetolactate synthase I/II/III large subunit